MYKNKQEKIDDITKNREVAAFSYMLILSPVLLFTRRDSPFIQFHAKQATLLFIAAVFFALLNKPWTWMNFFVLAISLTGFIQANLGVMWRAPVVANIIEMGIDGDRIWKNITHYANILKHVFVRKTQEKKKNSTPSNIPEKPTNIPSGILAQQNEMLAFQRQRIGFLEKELLVASILRKNRVEDMSETQQEHIKNITKNIADTLGKNTKITLHSYVITLTFGEKEVFFGGFEKSSNMAWVYTNFEIFGAETFGQFFGMNAPLDDEKEWKNNIQKMKT